MAAAAARYLSISRLYVTLVSASNHKHILKEMSRARRRAQPPVERVALRGLPRLERLELARQAELLQGLRQGTSREVLCFKKQNKITDMILTRDRPKRAS